MPRRVVLSFGGGGVERFASIEICEGRLAKYTEGDVLAVRLSINPERRSGDIASKEMLVGRGRRRHGSTTVFRQEGLSKKSIVN